MAQFEVLGVMVVGHEEIVIFNHFFSVYVIEILNVIKAHISYAKLLR